MKFHYYFCHFCLPPISGFGVLFGFLIIYVLSASVQRTAVNTFRGTVNVEYLYVRNIWD